MKMAERVARALADEVARPGETWEDVSDKAELMRFVLAGFRAMREPTDAMVAAAAQPGMCLSAIADIYSEMIDAAIAEADVPVDAR